MMKGNNQINVSVTFINNYGNVVLGKLWTLYGYRYILDKLTDGGACGVGVCLVADLGFVYGV